MTSVSNTAEKETPEAGSTHSKSTDSSTKNASDDHEWIQGIPLFMVLAGVTLVVFLMLLDVAILSTAVPEITSHFHSLDDVAWYGSAYTISSAALTPLTGKFYSHFSSKWTFLFFFGLFELGSLLCGVATSSKMLIIGRAVGGMGGSGMINGALNIIAGAVPMQKRPPLIGIMMGVGQLGLVLGPLIGGAFTTYSTWRWCFYINLPFGGLVAILLVFTKMPEQTPKGPPMAVLRDNFVRKFDFLGFTLFAPAAIQLLLALQYGGHQYAWNSATVIGLFCGSGGTFIVFFLWEWHEGDNAMIPLRIIRRQIVWTSCILAMMFFGMTMVLAYYLPIYFQSVRGRTAIMSGVDMLPNILSQLVAAVGSGILMGKIGYYLPWAFFGAVLTTIGNGLLTMLSPTTPTGQWVGYQILVGFGRGACMQVPMIAVQNAVTATDVSPAMATLTFAQTFGGAIFLALAEVIFAEGLRDKIPQFAPTASVEKVIAAGATGFRAIVSSEQLGGVLMAYAKSIGEIFYMAVGLGVVALGVSFGIGWKDIRKNGEGKGKGDEESGSA
ncbi:MFS general substrate transporter [Aspergillus steynii IBT 23096]|uniref:MFS general substrate transporter n=1 Tax=Aspergillus steynii IBT 23096 TaxID=1392250 RepID=A0A2I2GMM8_9EURO|nr:MFS general substrate transporter [Aspergillus steynii IBT 23096]PLB54151.1 MFS general substrate transporter [Aspergillus steynii IBT 23096]